MNLSIAWFTAIVVLLAVAKRFSVDIVITWLNADFIALSDCSKFYQKIPQWINRFKRQLSGANVYVFETYNHSVGETFHAD